MKFLKSTFFLFLLFVARTNTFGQQNIRLFVTLDSITNHLHVTQTIVYKNSSIQNQNKIIVNDWNHAYSDKNSNLGKRFSDEFVRNFHLSREKERGYTKINSILINNQESGWGRLKNKIDLIEIPLVKELLPNDSVTIQFDYILKIPDEKFTRYGYNKGNFYLKDFFLNISRINENGQFVAYSNENLDDASNEIIEAIYVEFVLPKYYSITSNLFLKDERIASQKTIAFSGNNLTNIHFAIEIKNSFENFINETTEVETNLNSLKITEIQRAIVIDKVIKYVESTLGKSASKKIMISQIEYDRNPFYGLNQLPGFLSPFPNSFLYELKFLKAYTSTYLKQNLKIDYRKDHYIFNAIQMHLMTNYISEHYPDLTLVGNLSKFKIFKGYQLAKAKFNDQYELLYLLMARRNLDQGITDSREKLIKFNEQLSNKFKAGLSFQYLNKYLNNSAVTNSFNEFLVLNNYSKTSASDFETIVKKNAGTNIDWFFKEIIKSNKSIDYTFGKTVKKGDSIQIKIINNANKSVPITITGFKKRTQTFEKWLPSITSDTILSFPKNTIDKLIINHTNNLPEVNNRNNFKSLKGFLSLNRPIKFALLRDIENEYYNQVFYVPEVGYNLYDGAILSLNVHNRSFIEKPFVYDFSPSYSMKTTSLTGSGGISYNYQKQNSRLYQIRYGINGSFFHYIQDANYIRLTPSVSFRFRDLDLRDNKRQTLTFRQVIVNKEENPIKSATTDLTPLNYSVFDARYGYGDGETAKGIGFASNLQLSSKFGKLVGEVFYRKLFENNYQIGLRLYAGSFIYKKTETDYFSFGLDRPKDYLFDYNYYGRSENSGIFSQQLIIAEGGFKSKFTNPYANQWITSINATSSIWKSIQLYGDAGFYKNKGTNPKFVYDSGIQLSLVPDYFELFFPVYSSNGFEMQQRNYQGKIRFIVTLSPKTLISLFTRKWF